MFRVQILFSWKEVHGLCGTIVSCTRSRAVDERSLLQYSLSVLGCRRVGRSLSEALFPISTCRNSSRLRFQSIRGLLPILSSVLVCGSVSHLDGVDSVSDPRPDVDSGKKLLSEGLYSVPHTAVLSRSGHTSDRGSRRRRSSVSHTFQVPGINYHRAPSNTPKGVTKHNAP